MSTTLNKPPARTHTDIKDIKRGVTPAEAC